MPPIEESVMSSFASKEPQDDSKPLWRFVTVLENNDAAGGNKRWKCNFCQKEVTSSYSRVTYHLLNFFGKGVQVCTKINDILLDDLNRICKEVEKRLKPTHVPLPTATDKTSRIPPVVPQKRRKSSIKNAFNVDDRNHLRQSIARMFYSSGLSFHLARNPYYVSSYSFAANHNLNGFLPPSYNALRTTLLKQERAHIDRLLQPIKSLWTLKGVTLVSDGWTDVQRRPLINFIGICEGGPIFLKAIDGSGEYKDKFYMANIFKDVIKEVGPHNVVQIITDNALVSRNIDGNEEVYNECNWITEVVRDVSFIKTYIMTHSMALAIFNEFSTLKLLSIGETRFASMLVMLKRIKLLKIALQTMVISDKWSTYREDNQGRAAHVKELILNDVWWDKIDYILSFTNPIYEMLRICDTDASTLHLVYEMWDSMIANVRAVIYRHEGIETTETSNVSPFYDVVDRILNSRWGKSCTPLHCLAHSLNPRYYSDVWLTEAPNRVPPHQDPEISNERNKCLKRYFPLSDERNKVYHEFAQFSSCSGDFASFDSIEGRYKLDAKSWWVTHGSSTRFIQKIALKLLVQPCSSSCSERNWSTYSFIHSMKRNKMDPKRAEDLVYVHTNLRLLSRKEEGYKKGETKLWDISGDAHEALDAVGIEFAALSLDEPELEVYNVL
ncbi:hypothetical protein TSUD_155560 [Trifolium subterraneum]|uniref:BED-type domain-containing protein n=1 Tax=Trifolium subterraneum TaxID=3900 RepID=A0A2Z6NHT8_TRISU|nr:hypothetical protein TSUD_155560 [Trifolium subterraneum]